jgi:hypothetical protein
MQQKEIKNNFRALLYLKHNFCCAYICNHMENLKKNYSYSTRPPNRGKSLVVPWVISMFFFVDVQFYFPVYWVYNIYLQFLFVYSTYRKSLEARDGLMQKRCFCSPLSIF